MINLWHNLWIEYPLPLTIMAAILLLSGLLLGWFVARQRAQAVIDAITARAAQASENHQALAVRCDDLNKALHERDQRVQQMQFEQRLVESKYADVQTQYGEQGKALKTERAQVESLQAKLSTAHANGSALEASLQNVKQQLQDCREQLSRREADVQTLQQERNKLMQTSAELTTQQEEREASFARELARFDKQKQELSEHFKVLANDVLAANTRALQENSKHSISAVLNPFQQSIDSFKKEVQDIHHRESTQQGELKKELASLKALNQQITTEAHELSTALRGQKKLQGNWGELVLENVLDRSGLQQDKDYKREFSVTTEEGRQRPDAVVFLPQDKHLVIDAKVSLNAYTRYVNAEDEAERALALNEHVKAMSDRIQELSDKSYYQLPSLNSPDMVFMFVPIESAFVEALKADDTLFQRAVESQVLVATPTTLLTSLNIVRQLWRYEDQSKHTAALAQKAESVFKKLNSFLDSFSGIKKHLEKATESYNKAEGQLLNGRGNLVKQVGEFKNLAPAIRAELPDYFTEKAALELHYFEEDEDSADSDIESA